ncbi:Putative serine/threonine-protein kinase, active [Septoria linicola]|uniref:non-specific serine/threonine protein kinase n=1 Tax=Septoria linicola TaxID=215465 RepID=A0A9Q9ARH5_9PEZI|nr:putative serine/threonine-protein kinase, active [Septoria linicola]USW53229.1 Putative serine/threonine-protein kinase, active [Septoria linicola]
MSAGDLSLSQSLGGLRIANPDNDVTSPTSPTTPTSRPPPPSSHSSESTVTDARRGNLLSLAGEPGAGGGPESGMDSGLESNPNDYEVQAGDVQQQTSQPRRSPSVQQNQYSSDSRLVHRSSMHLTHQAQQQAQFPGYNPQFRNPSVQSISQQRMSGMYSQVNNSQSSGISHQSGYRYNDEMAAMSDGSGGLARSGSRSARTALAGAIPTREASRSYRQPGPPMNGGGNGPLPPRRNSGRGRAPTSGSSSTGGYDGEGQPYAGSAPMPRSRDEWDERGAAMGTRKETDASSQSSRIVKKGVKDFNFGRTLGEGSYSTVLAATDRQNLKEYAIKVLDKRHIIKEKKVKYVNIERDTLNRLTEHPGIVRLYYTFQDERSLYFVLDLATGGELLGVLKRLGSFDMECTRFYGAEILDSIAYMHSRGVIHRDLKPENVLLDREMHVKITDFGTAKILPEPDRNGSNAPGGPSGRPTDGAETDRAVSFVGTAEYVSPELLRDKNACKASDLWAFGCIIYQLLAGRPPFKAANEYLTFQKILALDYTFPDGFPEVARDLVERLLVLEPERRLPVEHIKSHRFFDGVQWGKSLWRQKAPRLKAHIPPPAQPIKLNGTSVRVGGGGGLASSAAAIALSSQPQQTSSQQPQQPQQPQTRRPQLQNVTELPPPSQLDIDWSPVLTHNNERILKLGNLVITATSQSNSPTGKNGEGQTPTEKPKFSRFFSGNTTKKRERLVLITSYARLVVAPAGGNEKKSKMEINLAASNATCKTCVDSKGLTYWTIDTRDKHYILEDPRATTSDPAGSKYSTQEWLDCVEQAREVAIATSMTNSYSGESMLNDPSNMSSPADSMGDDAVMPMSGPSAGERHGHNLRHTLRRNTDEDDRSLKGRKRFSKRHSKSGLAAVF